RAASDRPATTPIVRGSERRRCRRRATGIGGEPKSWHFPVHGGPRARACGARAAAAMVVAAFSGSLSGRPAKVGCGRALWGSGFEEQRTSGRVLNSEAARNRCLAFGRRRTPSVRERLIDQPFEHLAVIGADRARRLGHVD